ncbi:MAG: hypothetical protein JWO69_1747 [Thermoleophilia bacterium]|nr:hypothetical protein [Thermoleophilia bacterium]
MHAVADPRRPEAGFTIVELIVAAILLAVALGGAVTLAAGTSRSSTTSVARQAQTAILASAAEKVRADSSWTNDRPLTCGSIGSRIDITAWLTNRISRELAADSQRGTGFLVTASANAVDSAADGRCPDDADGIVPDYYDIEVVARPNARTAANIPDAGPLTQRFQVDFSSRTSGGRLSIQACYASPQTDERIPTGSCEVEGEEIVMLPPSAATGVGGSCGTTSAECRAWTCAHPLLQSTCSSGGAGLANAAYVSLRPIAASGWRYTVRGADANTASEPVRSGVLARDGSATIDAMLPGRYEVRVIPPANTDPWETHSVPASGVATVERGIRSRIVQMFRPARRTQSIRFPVETRDITRPPWETTGPDEGYPVVPYYKGGGRTYSLMPAPVGRSSRVTTATLRTNGREIVFENPDPGLYAGNISGHQLSTGTRDIDFFFVPATNDQPIMVPESQRVAPIRYDWCDAPVRESDYVVRYGLGTTLTNPYPASDPRGAVRTWKVTSCYSSSSGGGPGPPPPTPGGGGNA